MAENPAVLSVNSFVLLHRTDSLSNSTTTMVMVMRKDRSIIFNYEVKNSRRKIGRVARMGFVVTKLKNVER